MGKSQRQTDMRSSFQKAASYQVFIANFYCHEARLVVVVDGDIHNDQTDYDDGRSAEMEKFGIIVLRVTNSEVETSLEKVIYKIETIVNERLKSPPWGI
jgi:very-short-patch-repair endonuclease